MVGIGWDDEPGGEDAWKDHQLETEEREHEDHGDTARGDCRICRDELDA